MGKRRPSPRRRLVKLVKLVKLGAHDVAAQEYADSQTDDQEAQRGWFGRGSTFNSGASSTFKSGAKCAIDDKRPGPGIETGGIQGAWIRVCKPRNYDRGNVVWYLNNEPGEARARQQVVEVREINPDVIVKNRRSAVKKVGPG